MTPQQLYDVIKKAYPQSEVASVCHTNVDCLRYGFCPAKQSRNVVDFDSVKIARYKGQTPTPASVDAVCVSSGDNCRFCFVELKGWQRYIDYANNQKCTPEETATGYNLAGKLADSQRLCMELTLDDDLFATMPVQFILVTDIDTESNGIVAFQSLLNQLSQTSTHLYSECLTQARKSLDSEIYIDKAYITCKDFDKFLCTI